MNDNTIATVGDLIAALSNYDPAAPRPDRHRIRRGHGPHHRPCRAHSRRPDSDCALPNGTGEAYCCLPDSAADALGWS